MTWPPPSGSGPRPPRVLLACDKFKGTLSSFQVADAIRTGMRRAAPDVEALVVPVADGGDGSLDVVTFAGAHVTAVLADDAAGVPRTTAIAIDRNVATIEVARICGLGASTPTQDEALDATSRGVGQAMLAALDAGARTIVIAVGGTATSDGGAGLLQALGARLENRQGEPIAPGARGLAELHRFDLSTLDPRLDRVEIVVACDVGTPLLGENGVARMFSPQKGVGSAGISIVETGLDRLSVFAGQSLADRPGAGAGGGIGFAAFALRGRMVAGADYFLDLAGFDRLCSGVDLVVTGEGRLDEQSLHGKAPVEVARRAHSRRVTVAAVVGSNALADDVARGAGFDHVKALVDIDPQCVTDPDISRRCLSILGEDLAVRYLVSSHTKPASPTP